MEEEDELSLWRGRVEREIPETSRAGGPWLPGAEGWVPSPQEMVATPAPGWWALLYRAAVGFFNHLPQLSRAGIAETCDTQAQDHKQPTLAGECCSSRFSLEITSSTTQITTCLFATHFMLQRLFSFDSTCYLPVRTQSLKSFSDRSAFASQKCTAMSGDILVATSILWVETRDTTKHTTVLGTTPTSRELFSPKCPQSQGGGICSGGRSALGGPFRLLERRHSRTQPFIPLARHPPL